MENETPELRRIYRSIVIMCLICFSGIIIYLTENHKEQTKTEKKSPNVQEFEDPDKVNFKLKNDCYEK